MAKTATRSVELEPIDRLEEKVKRLVGMVERMKAEQARAAEENQRLSRELDAMRARLAASDGLASGAVDAEGRARHDPDPRQRDAGAARSAQPVERSSCFTDGRRAASIPVEIHGQRYPIRSALEPEYVARLAATSTRRCGPRPTRRPTGDSLRLAVLAALNIADELFRCRDANRARDGQLAERAGELERLLDRVLMAS